MAGIKKYARRAAKRAGRALKRRYFRGKGYGRPNVVRMASDVMKLKSIINSEKREFILNNTSALPLGQVDGNGSGAQNIDITPIPAIGDGPTNRTGDSIKCTSCVAKFQFWQQTATTNPIRVRICIVRVLGEPQSVSSPLNRMLVTNPFVTGAPIKDYNSQPNTDYLAQYDIVAKRTFTVRGDQVTGGGQVFNVQIPMRLGKSGMGFHTKFSDGTTTPTLNQYVMYIVTDNGNRSSAVASTLGNLPVSAIDTGLWMNYNIKWYYYDN